MKLLRTVTLDADHVSVSSVADALGVGQKEIDEEYGVVPVDVTSDLYAILVEVAEDQPLPAAVHSNPPIVPFGPSLS